MTEGSKPRRAGCFPFSIPGHPSVHHRGHIAPVLPCLLMSMTRRCLSVFLSETCLRTVNTAAKTNVLTVFHQPFPPRFHRPSILFHILPFLRYPSCFAGVPLLLTTHLLTHNTTTATPPHRRAHTHRHTHTHARCVNISTNKCSTCIRFLPLSSTHSVPPSFPLLLLKFSMRPVT